jgi:hypothetical protein
VCGHHILQAGGAGVVGGAPSPLSAHALLLPLLLLLCSGQLVAALLLPGHTVLQQGDTPSRSLLTTTCASWRSMMSPETQVFWCKNACQLQAPSGAPATKIERPRALSGAAAPAWSQSGRHTEDGAALTARSAADKCYHHDGCCLRHRCAPRGCTRGGFKLRAQREPLNP